MPRRGTQSRWLGWMLSDGEFNRFFSESGAGFIGKPRDYANSPLYSEYGDLKNAMDDDTIMTEDDDMSDYEQKALRTGLSWDDPTCSAQDLGYPGMLGRPSIDDHEAFKTWLERRYRPDDPSLGSPLYQQIMEFYTGPQAPKGEQGRLCAVICLRMNFVDG